MTLNEIKNIEQLSVRSYNICRNNGLSSLAHILGYYAKNKTFKDLRNCGRRSEEELIAICEKYESQKQYKIHYVDKKESFESLIILLTRDQRGLINNFIDLKTKDLSVRSRNAVSIYLKKNFNVRNFSNHLIIPARFNLNNIPNVGKRSIPELKKYIAEIKEYIIKVSGIKDDYQIITLKSKLAFELAFPEINSHHEALQSDSIFILVNFLISQEAIFDKQWNTVFKKGLKVYNGIEHSLIEIAEILGLSGERVRQIRVAIIKELSSKFMFIKKLKDDLSQKYGIDIEADYIDIDTTLVDEINQINSTSFTREFCTYLIYIYLSDRFSLIGEVEDVIQERHSNNRSRHNWSNYYLVNKDIANKIDFSLFTNDIDSRLLETIKETYEFNFKSYLSKFISDDDINTIESVYPIAERIINEEFNLYLDLNDNIIFKRNTIKAIYEYAYEALDSIGEPSNIETIFYKVTEDYPNFEGNEGSIRAAMKRDNGFVPIGRSSVFGLMKWENENLGFRGGTIKDIVYDYLAIVEEPIHILELLNEIHKYREKTNPRNVITNLKLDPENKFQIFNQSFIGLENKTYNSKLTDLPRFFGKKIVKYVSNNENILKEDLISYFANKQGIDHKSMSKIIQLLLYNKTININNKNEVTR